MTLSQVADVVGAARELQPRIVAAADEIERERALPGHLVDALWDAGLFRMLLPRSLGGLEIALPTFTRAVEALAEADGSVGWCVGQANGLAAYMAYLDRRATGAVFNGQRVILANGPGEHNQPGRAVRVDGGYRVTGKWMFASGFNHATWLLGVCYVYSESDTEPESEIDGRPGQRLMLFPKSAVQMHDIWHVSGLRGTGSQCFSVDDLFVPDGYQVHFSPRSRHEAGPLYQFSNNGIFGPAFGSVSLGLATAALGAFVDFAAGKVPRGFERAIRENTTVQAATSQSHARLGAARAYLRDTLDTVWANVCARGTQTDDERVAVRLAATHATHESAAVVDTVYTLAGSHAIFEDRPFERRFRDIHAVSQQLQARRNHYEHTGRYLLGLGPDRAFL